MKVIFLLSIFKNPTEIFEIYAILMFCNTWESEQISQYSFLNFDGVKNGRPHFRNTTTTSFRCYLCSSDIPLKLCKRINVVCGFELLKEDENEQILICLILKNKNQPSNNCLFAWNSSYSVPVLPRSKPKLFAKFHFCFEKSL